MSRVLQVRDRLYAFVSAETDGVVTADQVSRRYHGCPERKGKGVDIYAHVGSVGWALGQQLTCC